MGEAAFAAVGNANVVMFLLFGVHVRLFDGLDHHGRAMRGRQEHRRGEARRRHQRGFLSGPVARHERDRDLRSAHRLVAWLRTPADALPLALTYMRIIFLALPFMGGLFFFMAVLRGAGDSRTPVRLSVAWPWRSISC